MKRRSAPSMHIAVVGKSIRAGILRNIIRAHFSLVLTPQTADLIFVDMADPHALDNIRKLVKEGRRVVAVMDADEAFAMGAEILQEGVRGILYAPFRAEHLRNLVEGILLDERLEAEVKDSFRALHVTLSHHVLNALTPIKLKSSSLLHRLHQGEIISSEELKRTLERFLRAVERVEGIIRDLETSHPTDRETYHGSETMIRLPRKDRSNPQNTP